MSLDFDPTRVVPKYTYEHPDGEKYHYDYSNKLESAVGTILFGDIIPSPNGYFPEWDFVAMLLEATKIEMKLRTTEMSPQDWRFPIEIYRENRLQKSALLLTEAKYYLLLSNEWNTGYGRVIKCRLISVDLLKALGEEAIKNKEQHF